MDRFNQTDLPQDLTQPIGAPSHSRGGVGRAVNAKEDTSKRHRFISATISTSSRPSAIVGPSDARSYLLIQNIGTVVIYLGFGVTPKLNGSDAILLAPNTSISFETGICPTNEINAVSNGTGQVAILDGTNI